MSLTKAELGVILEAVSSFEEAEGAPMFLGRPDRWYEHPHWRCVNEHVSTRYLKSEAHGTNVCLAAHCREPLFLTFPEDVDGPLDISRRQVQS